MLNGLYHLSKCGVIHQDLKPDNILVSGDFLRIKICDMGSGCFLTDGVEQTPYLVSRFYRSPEVRRLNGRAKRRISTMCLFESSKF